MAPLLAARRPHHHGHGQAAESGCAQRGTSRGGQYVQPINTDMDGHGYGHGVDVDMDMDI